MVNMNSDDEHREPNPQASNEDAARAGSLELQNIAGNLRRSSSIDIRGPKLDPLAVDFDARAWVKEFVKIHEADPKAAPLRALGVAFQNLNVFGWNTGAQFQDTVSGIFLTALSHITNAFQCDGRRKRVDILRNFEGVIEKGEMLLVLGPPGSGCSTLLKTLAGETSDLRISSDSQINFRGKLRCIKSFPQLAID